jgi:hypothetical protein
MFKRGHQAYEAIVQEIYTDPEGVFYLLLDELGHEIQVEGHHLYWKPAKLLTNGML